MCLTTPENSRTPRRIRAFACACLAIGLSLHLFLHPAGSTQNSVLHFVVGLLLGISIVGNLHALVLCRRNRANHA